MKYSETGKFTKEQISLAKTIARNLKKLRDTGCILFAKQDTLCCYLKKDYAHRDLCLGSGDGYEIPNIECGRIDDAGADDTEYFEEGYITED